MQALLLFGLGAAAMWAYRKITGGGIAGPLDGPRPKRLGKGAPTRWRTVPLRNGTTQVVALPYSFSNKEAISVLCYRSTPQGNYVTHRGTQASERMFRAAILELNLKVPTR